MKTTLVFSALFLAFQAGSALAATDLGFVAELQCSIQKTGAKATLDALSPEKQRSEQADLMGEVNREVTFPNGRTYSVKVIAKAAALTTNTNEITFHQFLSIQEKDGSFRTTARSGPTMFRMESFSDLAGGFFKNTPRALCNMFNCSELAGNFGVLDQGVISVSCQIRGK